MTSGMLPQHSPHAGGTRHCLVIANLVHASPRIPGLLGYSTEFGWSATVVTPVGTRRDPRVRKPVAFEDTVRVIEVPGRGDVFWLLRKFMRRRGSPSVAGTEGGSRDAATAGIWHRSAARLRHFAHLFLAYPDSERTWIRPMLRAAREAARQGTYDLVISSTPHPSVHVVAQRLSEELGLPWVADFRDNWSHNHNYPYGRLRHWLDKRLEKKTLARATLLTASTPWTASKLELIHGREARVVINGFIASERATSQASTREPRAPATLLITYLGSMYEGQQDPQPLLEALRELVEDDPGVRECVRLRFIGNRAQWVEPRIRAAQLSSMVEFVGEVPAATVDSLLRESDVLLLIGWRGVQSLLTKMFEYLKAGKEILVIGESPDSEAARIIATTGAGTLAPTQREIRAALERYRAEVRERGEVTFHARPEQVAKFEYRDRAREFFALLDEVLNERFSIDRT